MLIDFTIENFRSIKEPTTLSAIAQSHQGRTVSGESKRRDIKSDDEIAEPFIPAGQKFGLLPVIGIFGANASGKTNVIEALDFLLRFVIFPKSDSSNFNRLSYFTPFRLDSKTAKMPTRFELRVLRKNNIFIYTLILDRSRILQEKLNYIPSTSKKMQTRSLYNRVWDAEANKYEWKNGQDFGNTYKKFQNSLKEDSLFLSFLVSSFNIEVIEPFASWFEFYWSGINHEHEHVDRDYAAFLLKEDSPEMMKTVSNIIKQFDTGIQGIEIEKLESSGEDDNNFNVWVWHKTDKEPVRWLMQEAESLGTRKLFNLATTMLDCFRHGRLMVVDEFGSIIHPNITRAIIKLFQNKEFNHANAQLIFTSHDNTLQRKNLMRRDQIWFTQKRKDGSTELYPLSDFSPRGDLAIDKAYLDGRFGAIPIIPNEKDLLSLAEVK